MREGEEEGRSDFTWGTRRSRRQTRRRSELVEDGVLGRPRLNGGYREERLGVVSVLVCSGRQEVARLGRNHRRSLSGTVAV